MQKSAKVIFAPNKLIQVYSFKIGFVVYGFFALL